MEIVCRVQATWDCKQALDKLRGFISGAYDVKKNDVDQSDDILEEIKRRMNQLDLQEAEEEDGIANEIEIIITDDTEPMADD